MSREERLLDKTVFLPIARSFGFVHREEVARSEKKRNVRPFAATTLAFHGHSRSNRRAVNVAGNVVKRYPSNQSRRPRRSGPLPPLVPSPFQGKRDRRTQIDRMAFREYAERPRRRSMYREQQFDDATKIVFANRNNVESLRTFVRTFASILLIPSFLTRSFVPVGTGRRKSRS